MGDGLCKCGCGQKTKISRWRDKRSGYERGQPRDYLNGHANKLPYAFVLEDRGYTSPCWIWIRHIQNGGYALLSNHKNILGGSRYAHRYFYTLIKGPIPKGLDLDHLCRVRCCVNPNHLEPVTKSVNVRRGEGSKLTLEQIEEILDLRRNRVMMKDIATQFGIHISYAEALCHKGGICLVNMPTKVQKKEMLELRRGGMSDKNIADRYGINYKSVGRICRQGGVYTHKIPHRDNAVPDPHLAPKRANGCDGATAMGA